MPAKLIIWIAAVATALAAAPAHAVTITRDSTKLDGNIVMAPAAERIETTRSGGGSRIGPGSVVTRSVMLTNGSHRSITFDLDVAQVVGSDAEHVAEVRHGVRSGVTGWVELEVPSVTLAPGRTASVRVTINVPAAVRPGSKTFAVSATQRPTDYDARAGGVVPRFRHVSIFDLEIPGDAPVSGRLTSVRLTSIEQRLEARRSGTTLPPHRRWYVTDGWFDGSSMTIDLAYENTGERLLRPDGTIDVHDVLGRRIERYHVGPLTAYPDGQAAASIDLSGMPSLGIFRASVRISDETGTAHVVLPRFLLIPRWLLVAMVCFTVLLTALLAQRCFGRRYRPARAD